MNKKFLVDTDIIISHLTTQTDESSDLVYLMQNGICFTTVINAVELLKAAEGEAQLEIVRNILNAFKVLGLNSRYALKVPEIKSFTKNNRDILFLIVAKSNNLPIITYDKSKYNVPGIDIFNPSEIGG